MIFVDTGYFIALAAKRDQLHGRAVAWSQSLREDLLVTEYVLVETINQLSSTADRIRGATLARRIRAGDGYLFVPATVRLLDLGLNLHSSRADKNWSLTDCISFVVMRERGITQALAHDEHFTQAGFDAMLRRDPS